MNAIENNTAKFTVGQLNITPNTLTLAKLGEIPFEALETQFQSVIESKDIEGKLSEYKDILTKDKQEATLKKNGFTALISEKYFQKDYWDETLSPYLIKTGFVPEIIEKLELETKRNKNGEYESKEVMHVYVQNNLTKANKDTLPYTLKFMLENFELDNITKTEIQNCIELCKTTKSETILNEKVVKNNSEMFTDGSNLTNEDLNNKLLLLKGRLLKVQSSLDLLNFKLKQIKWYENNKEHITSDVNLKIYEQKVQKYLKTDKKGQSLRGIVSKIWGI